MKKKLINLPRGYLSHSQMTLFERDPKLYAKLYFDGRDELRPYSKAMDYGKKIAEALEHMQETGEVVADTAMGYVPKYDEMEYQIDTELKTQWGWLPLMGKLDTFDPDSYAFRDTKTGKVAWTEKRAQDHDQLHFYTMLIFCKFGALPPSAHIDWIETFEEDGEVKPTGRVESFETNIGMSEVLAIMARATLVAKDIEVAWAVHVPNEAALVF